jgi:hypothetical protein
VAKFRSRPVECEAYRFRPAAFLAWQTGPAGTPYPCPGVQWVGWVDDPPDAYRYVVTLTDGHEAPVVDGDWVVREDDRGYYPVKPDVFEKRWEPAGDEPEKR